MAYMTKDGKGPYPCYKDEYCGNHLVDSLPTLKWNELPEEAERNQEAYLARMRFGRPRSCEPFTSTEGESQGWVGLYLKKNDLPSWRERGDTLIDTPPELMEPEVINRECVLCRGTGQIVLFTSTCKCDCTMGL